MIPSAESVLVAIVNVTADGLLTFGIADKELSFICHLLFNEAHPAVSCIATSCDAETRFTAVDRFRYSSNDILYLIIRNKYRVRIYKLDKP